MKLDLRTLRMGFSWAWWLLRNRGRNSALRLRKGDPFAFQELKTAEGGAPSLSGASWSVFYFYPKDDTPGCTIEAREFTLLKAEFDTKKARIFGVSADGPESHKAFCDKYGIGFSLLIDEGGRLGQRIGNWRGVNHARTTILTDGRGQVEETWSDVRAAGHAQAVLDRIPKP